MLKTYLSSFVFLGALFAAAACSNSAEPDDGTSEDDIQASNACKNKACGAACSVCNGRPGCVESQEVKTCNATGKCTSEVAVCGGSATYEPCAGKKAGDTCKICSPDDRGCVESQDVKTCKADGTCSSGGTAYSPCAGKKTGDTCRICSPDERGCIESQEVKTCQANGSCGAGGDAYDPCAGKKTGDTCRLCAPGEAGCVESAVIKTCRADRTCK